MPIERRRTVVKLYQGHYEAKLSELLDAMMAADRQEEASEQRFSSRSQAFKVAVEYDETLTEADKTAEKVTVWALRWDQYQQLAEDYPPRKDVPADPDNDQPGERFMQDKLYGVNVETFAPVLMRASLGADPAHSKDATVGQLITRGETILTELGDLTQLHYLKIQNAAWNVNVGDDELPKDSAVSLLRQQREPDSKQPGDGE